MMNILDKYSKAILLTFILLFTLFFYHDVILSPNSYLFGSSGDGIKNYFTLATHIKENSLTQSTAMNYPYGEHFLYLDCHPALSLFLKAISSIFPFVADYSVGIINFMMLSSIGLTAWFLQLIFLHYKIRPIIAVLAGFSIAILAPQLYRITGHYALSYSFFLPLTWYLFIRFRTSPNPWKWSIVIGLSTLFWFFTHAYLGMIIFAFFMISYMFEGLFYFKQKILSLSFWAHMFIQLILPFLFIFLYSRLGDTHTGRTTNPFGFMEVTSNFDSVFLPNQGPLLTFFKDFNSQQTWESLSYVGMGTNIALCIFILYTLYYLIRFRRLPFNDLQINPLLLIGLISSIIVLIIACGYPFKWNPELLNGFEMVKNFRGIGRFAWAFYFTATIFAVVFITRLFTKRSKRFLAFSPVVLLCFSFIWEGVSYHRSIAKELNLMPNYFHKNGLDNEWKATLSSIDFTKYQAILPLPYYHIGSENFGKESTDEMYVTSMILGYYSKLPLTANHSGRTSIWEAKNNLQFISPVFYEKELLNDIKDNRPFLVIHNGDHLLEFEQEILNRSTLIWTNSKFKLYEITKAELFSTDASKWLNAFNNKSAQLIEKNGFLIEPKDSLALIYFNSFEDQKSTIARSGDGAMASQKRHYTLLKTFEPGELEEGREYILSFWLYNYGPNHGQDIPNGVMFQQVTKEEIEWVEVQNVSAGFIIDGNWSLIEMKFKGYHEYASTIALKGDDLSTVLWQIDDVLVRPADVTVYQKNKDFLWMNNHRIKLKR